MSERQNFLKRINYRFQKFLYLFNGEKFFKKKRYDWGKYPKRFEIIQDFIDHNKYNSYLEIGCDRNQNFSNIRISKRIGVDPVEGGTHKMTSDIFFLENNLKFDIIFIDGLHEYTQVMKDIKNSLKFLNSNGVILLHDCLPRTIWNQITPRINSDWNGDVWKSIVHCRTMENIDTYTLIADRGIGLIFPRKNRYLIKMEDEFDFKKLRFKQYYEQHEYLMNTINYEKSKINDLFK